MFLPRAERRVVKLDHKGFESESGCHRDSRTTKLIAFEKTNRRWDDRHFLRWMRIARPNDTDSAKTLS